MEAIRTQCVQYLPTNSKVIIVSDDATEAKEVRNGGKGDAYARRWPGGQTPKRMEAIRTQCVQYLPTKSNFIILSHGATAAGWITNLVGCRNIIKLDSENEKPDGSCADREREGDSGKERERCRPSDLAGKRRRRREQALKDRESGRQAVVGRWGLEFRVGEGGKRNREGGGWGKGVWVVAGWGPGFVWRWGLWRIAVSGHGGMKGRRKLQRVVPHGGVILFDETANLKPDFVQTCYNLLSQEYGNIPIVLCSNKADVNHAMMMGNKNICWKMENNISLPYFEISANNDHNLEAPFLYLAKKLTENDKQQPPVLISPHIQMDMTAAQHGPESDPAAAQPFPVEDNNGCCSACLKPLVACLKACYYLVSIAVAFMNCVEEA
ncbi:unnamed protein product [Prunus armeniaca]|uniref:Uncharacterized protein n=1 Tax=Prunus armeniaca TaxID=36596 RepID=A0A6J5TS57_PRUAR|nr:unnamed protein product [Prunus armeniaca]